MNISSKIIQSLSDRPNEWEWFNDQALIHKLSRIRIVGLNPKNLNDAWTGARIIKSNAKYKYSKWYVRFFSYPTKHHETICIPSLHWIKIKELAENIIKTTPCAR